MRQATCRSAAGLWILLAAVLAAPAAAARGPVTKRARRTPGRSRASSFLAAPAAGARRVQDRCDGAGWDPVAAWAATPGAAAPRRPHGAQARHDGGARAHLLRALRRRGAARSGGGGTGAHGRCRVRRAEVDLYDRRRAERHELGHSETLHGPHALRPRLGSCEGRAGQRRGGDRRRRNRLAPHRPAVERVDESRRDPRQRDR